MGVIEDFVAEYEREVDYWDAAARTVRGLLEVALASSGLRAIVTSRAKSPDRLLEKLRGRNSKASYRSSSQIRRDISDLAGVRVALYFPGQMDEVERIIGETLTVQESRRFPSVSAVSEPSQDRGIQPQGDSASTAHIRRFSGYGARHFRVRVPESRLSAGQARYAAAIVEVQVASVLMHAWSEVEHDLVYKPLEGQLSASEHALLDQLNGLILAGEIALEQLQKAGDARLSAAAVTFRNHYELAEYLRTRLSQAGQYLNETTLGRVDVLFEFLAREGAVQASSVEGYVDSLEQDFERRPVAAQLADLILSGDEARYASFLREMAAVRYPSTLAKERTSTDRQDRTRVLGEFVAVWVLLENELSRLSSDETARRAPLSRQIKLLLMSGDISAREAEKLDSTRRLRNEVLHSGDPSISIERLREATATTRGIYETLAARRMPLQETPSGD